MTDSDQDKDAPVRLENPSIRATPKAKPSHGGPKTKADHAAAKRIDKTVIKRMRKR